MKLNVEIIENGLVIDEISSIDVDLETFYPGDNGFMIVVDLCIGIENEKGKDKFRFTLADKRGFEKSILGYDESFIKNGMTSLNNYHIHIIDSYSFPKLIKGLTEIMMKIDVDKHNWSYNAEQLYDYFNWEYHKEQLVKLKTK
jgi:hypothetical protein